MKLTSSKVNASDLPPVEPGSIKDPARPVLMICRWKISAATVSPEVTFLGILTLVHRSSGQEAIDVARLLLAILCHNC